MRLFAILFILSSCSSNGPNESACVTFIHDVCHCRENSSKVVWLKDGATLEDYLEACSFL